MRWETEQGGYRVREVHDGHFRLDGGAMFGVVPRPLWSRLIPPDSANRIPLALRCLLLERDDRKILIDTGIGGKWSEKERSIYGIDHRHGDLVADLASLGVAPEAITDVLLTHLHFDHAGGNTRLDDAGEVVPVFPEATYFISTGNRAHADDSDERDHVSYMPVNWQVLEARGQLTTFEAPGEPVPGIRAERWDGHTPGMVTFHITDPAKPEIVYGADLIPTAAHLRLNYVMGYDLCARQTIREKRDFLARAEAGDWRLVYEHDPVHACSRVRRDERGRFGPGDFESGAGIPGGPPEAILARDEAAAAGG